MNRMVTGVSNRKRNRGFAEPATVGATAAMVVSPETVTKLDLVVV